MDQDFENRLKQLIKESIREVLNEMAMSRSDYIQRVLALLPQIAQNWCLCYFACNLSDNPQHKALLQHWATELKSLLENLEDIKLKNGDKKKTTDYALINAEDLNTNINNIVNKIKYVFQKENINDNEIIENCAMCFQNELFILSDIISNQSDFTASEYVDDKYWQ